MTITKSNVFKKFIWLAALVLPALAGCGSAKDASKSNFEKVINAALEKQCIDVSVRTSFLSSSREFPLSVPTVQAGSGMTAERAAKRNTDDLAPYEALVGANLVTVSDGQVKQVFFGGEKDVPGKIYALTEAGKKALRDPKSTSFCAGRYKVDEVVNFTEPGNAMGVTISQVNYTVKAIDVPAWASNVAIRSAFPGLAREMDDKSERRATLILQNDGWTADISRL